MTALLDTDPTVAGTDTDPELKASFTRAELQAALGGGNPTCDRTHVSILHLVHWAVGANTNIISSRWYTYKCIPDKSGGGMLKRIGPNDIYRRYRAEFISLEYFVGAPGGTLPVLTYSVTITKTTPANYAALGLLFTAVTGASGAKAVSKLVPVAQVLVAQSLSGSIDSSKTPAPFAWAFTMTAVGAGAGPGGDCSHLTAAAKCTVTQSFTSLEAEYWNIGINIIPYGPRENKYSQSSTGTISQSHTLHSPLYAVVDINPFAHVWSMLKGPYLQAGLPLSGAAFHLPYVGLAQPVPGLSRIFPVSFSVYGGVVFMKQTFPKTLAIGQTVSTSAFNADLTTDRAVKPLWGIEVPIGAIASKIKGATFK